MSVTRHQNSKLGVVAAGDRQSAEAGVEILRAGGNAADAAVASGLAACVCEIALCGPLGGGVAVSHFGQQSPTAWDFFARVPGLGHSLDERLEFGQAVIDFGVTQQTFQVGRGAASLGLALPGMLALHKRHGRLPLSEVVKPAIELGRSGYIVGEQMAYILSLIEPIFKWTPASYALCFPDRSPPVKGTRLYNPHLADVFEVIGRSPNDVRGLYEQFAREFGPDQGGLITSRDIEDLSVRALKPIEFGWHDWTLSSMPSPSSGGVLIGIGARLLKSLSQRAEFGSLAHYESIAEVQRKLLEIRTDDFDERIESEAYVNRLLTEISVEELLKLSSPRVGDNYLGSTTQISAMDGAGDVVSMTLTNGEGCGCVLDGCGIQVNNLLGEEDINPKGFHQAEAGSFMQTMMAPTIGYSGRRRIALGSGGSNRLRNAILTTLLNVIEYDMPLEKAVHQPRLHVDRSSHGVGVNIECQGIPEALPSRLNASFDNVTAFDAFNMFFGGVHAVESINGVFSGVGDKRRGGQFVLA